MGGTYVVKCQKNANVICEGSLKDPIKNTLDPLQTNGSIRWRMYFCLFKSAPLANGEKFCYKEDKR